MRQIARPLLFALAMSLATPVSADANYTIDLIWALTGETELLAPTEATEQGTLCHAGANAPALLGSCLLIRLTADAPFRAAIVSLGWNTQGGDLQVAHVAPRSFGQFGALSALGPTSPNVVSTSGCAPFCTEAFGSFGGAAATIVSAGTYVIGSVLFDVPGCCFPGPVLPFLRPGVGGLLDKQAMPAPVQLNGATIFYEPEPATAGLLGLGLVGLAAFSPRRRR